MTDPNQPSQPPVPPPPVYYQQPVYPPPMPPWMYPPPPEKKSYNGIWITVIIVGGLLALCFGTLMFGAATEMQNGQL